MRVRSRHRAEEGSIAVIAAVVLPVVLTVIAVAFSSLVWGASETEVQRSADTSSTAAAATTPLLEFPYASIAPLPASAYPTLSQVAPSQLLSTLPTVTPCSTIGNPVGATSGLLNSGGLLGSTLAALGIGSTSTLTTAVNGLSSSLQSALNSLPTGCGGYGPIAPFPVVPGTVLDGACARAAAAVTDSTAPYSTRFYKGTAGETQPTCANGRIRVGFATGSPLLGFGGSTATVGSTMSLSAASGVSTVQNDLAGLGVRLDTTLPNTLCPQVNIAVDQPVAGPVIPITSEPNGRASAVRVVKNAVVVPVFNGLALPPVTGSSVAQEGVDGLSTVTGSGTISAVNLNSTLLQNQQMLLGVLDTLDATMNQTLTADAAGVAQLNGTTSAVDVTGSATLPAPLPAVSGNVGSLNLLSCLRNTLRQLYNPPSGDAASVNDVLSSAAASGSPVELVQVGVQPCSGAANATAAFSCVTAAVPPTAATAVQKLTGLYDVPILDVTPVMVRDIGSGNFLAVPVHASQANGAFRASLVRTDERWAP